MQAAGAILRSLCQINTVPSGKLRFSGERCRTRFLSFGTGTSLLPEPRQQNPAMASRQPILLFSGARQAPNGR
jgi:hypothetical protein